MLLDRLDTFEFATETPTKVAATGGEASSKSGLYFTAVVIAVAGYIALAAWILSTNTERVYGFAISHDPRTAIEIALQICPMLAAIFLVLLSGLTDRVIGRLAVRAGASGVLATVAVSAAGAAIVVAATTAAVIGVCGFDSTMPAPLTLAWVAAELMFDLTLIGVFTATLYRASRKVWLTMLLFIAYVALVVAVGSRWGITSYIGFGSTVPVTLTTYSTTPLYDGAGWLLRGYWTCVTLLLLSILHAFDSASRRNWRLALAVCIALLALCILVGFELFRLQRFANTRSRTPIEAALTTALQQDASRARLQLTHFALSLTYSPGAQTVAVKGNLTFASGTEPIHIAWFELPALIMDDDLRFSGGGPYRVQPFGKYIRVTFQDGIPSAGRIEAQYAGVIRPAGAFDLPMQAKVLESAFFLTDADLLLTARRAGCIVASQRDCGGDENYLMSDHATGTITVTAPERFTVAAAGEESDRNLSDGVFERTFSTSSPRLATFMVACAPFRKTESVAKNGAKIHVYRSSLIASDGDPEAPLGKAILDFYQNSWPAYSRSALTVIETPAPIGEALSYDGVLAISDKIINSRSPISRTASNLLDFVMAHEIAHQWWGYRVVPSRAPGRMFLTESIAQFAAYKFLNASGILGEQIAIQNESRRYQTARTRLGNREVPLAESQTGDEVAYNKGPFALLSLDTSSGGSLMNRLGGLVNAYSGESHGSTLPDRFIASMMNELPEQSRVTARKLVYGTGSGI